MKKYIIVCFLIICSFFILDALVYQFGLYIPTHDHVETFMKTDGKTILMDKGKGYEDFEIKGVDLGVGYPGESATDYAIDKDTYKRWFKQIQDMGANTIRVYTINGTQFYEAFYEYNKDNENPLYLIHGLWVNDYVQFSHMDAYDDQFLNTFLKDSRILVDVIHGKRTIQLNRGYGNGTYKYDISKWVIGYILGVEWEDVTVAYTNNMQKAKNQYQGKYMSTTGDASPFEAMLTRVGDQIIEYESDKYGQQRLVAFSNWPTTDPFDYAEDIEYYFRKVAKVDVEHIQTNDQFQSGTFVSYHIYPYYPDYLSYTDQKDNYKDDSGQVNTYYHYLKKINEHHKGPVVISEFGVPSSRGMAQNDRNTNRNQGNMSEQQQGQAIVDSYQDIKKAGCSGAIIFTWQDEWFKRTWNTMYAVDLNHTKNWSDYQTNEQYFGLLSFDPGEKESVCYVDGDTKEWTKDDQVISQDGYTLSSKYDEKFVYLKIDGYKNQKLYLPIDTLDSIGSQTMKEESPQFERDSDFVLVIDGQENSRLLVNHRYNTLLAMNSDKLQETNTYLNPPQQNTNQFDTIQLALQYDTIPKDNEIQYIRTYETGKLLHGNANPKDENFNSLADFYINDSTIEIKIPWQLLNFSDPSSMQIHDDYYLHYGVEDKSIDQLFIGIGDNDTQKILMSSLELKGWGDHVTFHERLKRSYSMVQDMWKEE